MSRPRCVVFDIDDTLYLEGDYIRSGFAAVGEWARQNLKIDDFGTLAWGQFERGSRHTVFDRALKQHGVAVTDDLIARMVEVYRAHAPRIALLEDARACIKSLAPLVRLAAISDGPPESQQAKVTALGLAKLLDPIVLTEALGRGFTKPHEHAFRLTEALTNCQGAECAYVGDNPAKDFVAPKALGWQTVRVRRAAGLHAAEPSGADVDIEIADLDRLTGLLMAPASV